jgi:RimJ/RimL family protein N-acetyltransferase
MNPIMHECPLDHPALRTLFSGPVPGRPVLWAVLNGRHTGRAWVDDAGDPSQCAVRTDAVLTFVSRGADQAFLDAAVAVARGAGEVWLVWPLAMAARLRAPEAAAIFERLEFDECDPGSSKLAALIRHLPEGFTTTPIDRALLERCEWRSDMEFFCGSLDSFLTNGIGLCMMHGDDIIVEVYASSLGQTHAEIGAVTRKTHRGRGFAPIACAYLIQECQQRGYQACWSCETDNTASIRVAQELGFQEQKVYQVLEYSALIQSE